MTSNVEKTFVALLFTFSTVIARHTKVERLTVVGQYKTPNCSVNVTCYIHSHSLLPDITWVYHGGPRDMSKVPGFTIGPLEYPAHHTVKQTVSIKRCYNKLELKCKVGSSSKSIELYSGKGIPVRIIVGIIFGVFAVALAVGYCIMRKRRATAKANTGEVVSLHPPPGTYPPQTTTMYPQDTVPTYPQVPVVSYPQSQASVYPQPQASVYPSQPATGYPSQPATGYPSQPATGYPPQPATGYPPQPATSYPPQPASGYPQQPASAYPPHPASVDGQPPTTYYDPPPYSSIEQPPPPPGFK